MGVIDFDDLRPGELSGPVDDQIAALVICWGDAEVMPATFSDGEWAAVLAARKALGRPLEAAEIVALLARFGVEHANG